MLTRICSVSIVVIMLSGCGGGDPASQNGTQPSGQSASAGNGDGQTESKFQMGIQSEPFGQTGDGAEITQYTLANGLIVSIINYGAIVTAVVVPDRDGHFENVVLGFEDLQGYLANSPYFGAICGRYSNRIRDGKFTLNGQEYTLAANNGPNHLHGGLKGFDKAVWHAEPVPDDVAADSDTLQSR